MYGFWHRLENLTTFMAHLDEVRVDRIERGELDPTRVITHRLPLAEAPHGYDIFKNKADGCEKVVLKP